jgi:hypothetical protein
MSQREKADTPPRRKMVGWFDPPRLVAIGIRVAISTVFGELADRREALAAARHIDPTEIDPAYNYEPSQGDFWLDFVADNGDGWNPTYAIARLLAEPELAVEGTTEKLPLARVLVMGGDQVYPTASREDYSEKLVEPFKQAAELAKISKIDPPHVYAVPGNHDWYDGLLAFLGLFCRRRKPDEWAVEREGREFGGRRTQQTRSYFALALPNNWWLWGVDIQLAGYVDQPQVDFFTHVASEWMGKDSKLILCTGQPSWAYIDSKNPGPAFKNFSYLERIATMADKNHRLCAVLTGDSHHYSRYVEGDCQYITAGGGGAFLHPTHHLEDIKNFDWEFPPPGPPPVPKQPKYKRTFALANDSKTGKPSLFPDKPTSKRLSYRNFAFAFLNWQYACTLGGACLFFAWLLHAQAQYTGSSLLSELAPLPLPAFSHSVCAYLRLVFISPWPITMVLLVAGGYYYLADFADGWRRVLAGALHTAVQAGSVMLATCVLARWLAGSSDGWLILSVGVAGGLLSATLLGVYFLFCLNVLGKHWNEAFSSLRIQDYKCFLRLRFQPNGTLKIYPIGLTDVPRESRSGPLRNPPLHPHLIEGPVDVA